MRYKNESYIRKLMVLGSTVCNLNCSYCYLSNQHRNNSYVLLNKKIQKAWIDGTYVNNIKKVFESIECGPNTVEDIEIWGGEPLIITNNLVKPIYELLTYFPYVNSMNIPTNFTRINGLIDFIESIEKAKEDTNWSKKSSKRMQLHIQLSIDAPAGDIQTNCHQVDWQVYRDNVENLCRQISELQPLKNIEVDFEWHATLPFEIIDKYLTKVEDIEHYLNEFHEFGLYTKGVIKKYNLQRYVMQSVGTMYPHTAQPYKISIEDALKAKNNLYILNYIQSHLDYIFRDGSHIYAENGFSLGGTSLLNPNPVCLESGIMGLTIMYDGTICECPCDFILCEPTYWEWIKENPIMQQEYRDSMMKYRFYINPITASQQEKDDYDWYTYDSYRLNNSTAIHLMMNWGLEISKSGQIDCSYYKNPERLLKHMFQFNNDYGCPREQIPAVHNCYMVSQYVMRRWYNGLTEMAQEDLKQDLLFEAEGVLKWNTMPQEFI